MSKTMFFTAKWCAPCQQVKRVLRPDGERHVGSMTKRELRAFLEG